MWRIQWAPNSIPIYIQQDATLHILFISGNCSTCFGWYFHPSSGAHTTVSTASGICHTVTAICRYRGIVGTGLSVLWVAYAISLVHTHQQLYDNMKVKKKIFYTKTWLVDLRSGPSNFALRHNFVLWKHIEIRAKRLCCSYLYHSYCCFNFCQE